MAAFADAAVLADDPAQPRKFSRHLIVQLDDLIECVGDLAVQPFIRILDADGEVTVSKGFEGVENLTGIELFL
ncbi:hypothetical protein [Mesorhizobium sp. WSM3864]|uniref:hypothetical protein n=1 Tax=unclassified Mesorhizobium TaxID=325217 RepID=UPI0032AEA99C